MRLSTQILSSEYLYSAHSISDLRLGEFSEIAFVGRSNVGKSSLLNALVSRKNLAVVGKTPGRTRAINFYHLKGREQGGAQFECQLVDLPGYGYAKVPGAMKEHWKLLIENYLLRRPTLSAVLLLIDVRRNPEAEEKWIASLGKGGNLLIVLTKIDQIKRNELDIRRKEIADVLGVELDTVLGVSVEKDKQGLVELRERVFAQAPVIG